MPPDPARRYAVPGFRAKQLLVLASDVVFGAVRGEGRAPDALAGAPVEGVLPGCYRSRYDGRFLATFHNVVELTRNALVSDLPHVRDTAGVLAALAILGEAHATAANGGDGRERLAAAIDPGLLEHLAFHGEPLRAELHELEGMHPEDTDALVLFDLPPDADPGPQLPGVLREGDRALLLFENWLVPFGGPPRPRITADGRAWPA